MAKKEKPFNIDPAKNSRKISLLYFLFGTLWIIISDMVKSYTESETIIHFSTDAAKGILFIAITALLLNYFLKKYFTRLKDTGLELKEREREYRTLAERLSIGIIKQQPNGKYIYMNPMAKTILKDFLKINGDTDVNGLMPEDIYSDKDVLARVNETINYVAGNKQRLLRKTKYGSRYFSVTTYPELDSSGNVLSVLSIMTDETDVMESMTKLEESETLTATW